jgi:hypothetical protein
MTSVLARSHHAVQGQSLGHLQRLCGPGTVTDPARCPQRLRIERCLSSDHGGGNEFSKFLRSPVSPLLSATHGHKPEPKLAEVPGWGLPVWDHIP